MSANPFDYKAPGGESQREVEASKQPKAYFPPFTQYALLKYEHKQA